MANWVQVTVDDLEAKKVSALVSALRTAALGTGQDEPTDAIIAAVVDRIRRKIASCASNALDSDELTVPRGLRTMAVDMVIAELKNRLEIELTEDERRRLEVHERDLDKIAAGKELVEQPDDSIEAPVQAASGSPTISAPARRFGRDNSDGV